MGNVSVRRATENDLLAVQELFYRSYGEDYPYKEFYNDEWLKRSIYQDSYLFLVAEVDGKIAGTASVYFEVGAYTDLCGEFGRLVVDPNYRGEGVGSALMEARLNFAQKRLHFGLAECRTAHTHAQQISEKYGMQPIGFLPQKVMLDKRESLVLMAKTFGPALDLRRNNPRVIPEIYPLGQLALQNLGLRNDLIAVADPPGNPIGKNYLVEELDESAFSSLLRIERGRTNQRYVFGNLQLAYGLFQLQSRNSKYLVAKEDNRILGAIGFTVDQIGGSIKILELISLTPDVGGFLLKEMDKWARHHYEIAYIEITISAYHPDIQQTLSNLGFVAVAYCPSFVFDKVERLDTVKMAKVYVPFDIDDAQITEKVRPIFEIVRKAFEEKRMGILVNETTQQMAVFDGLEEGEMQRVAALCQFKTYPRNSIVLQAGERGDTFYMVKSGSLDIYAADNETLVGQVDAGDFLGEISLVSQQPYSATAITNCETELIGLKYRDFENLIQRYPRIGLRVMRNIAISLGQKLHITNVHGQDRQK